MIKKIFNYFFQLIFRLIVMPILVLMLLAIVVFHFIPQSQLRALAGERIGAKLNRQVMLGRIRLDWRGLRMDEMTLSEIPSFRNGIFMTARDVRLGWDLTSLWHGLNIKKRFLTRSSGHFYIGSFSNPHYEARDFSLQWSLKDMDPSWTHMTGSAELRQGPGLLENIDELVAISPSAKLALAPVMALVRLERLGFLNLGLPDLKHWPLDSIQGDYRFQDGLMKIDRFDIASSQLGMKTTGTIELATGKLALDVELKSSPRTLVGALDIKLRVSGTTAHPRTDLTDLKKKAFKATLGNLLQGKPVVKVDDALKKIFR